MGAAVKRSWLICGSAARFFIPPRPTATIGLAPSIPKPRCRQSIRRRPLLSNRLLLIRRGFGCLALGFAQRSLLLLFSLFFLGACACCPLSLGPVSTVIRLECHWLPPCAAGCFSAPRLYIRTRSSFARPCHPAACWAI